MAIVRSAVYEAMYVAFRTRPRHTALPALRDAWDPSLPAISDIEDVPGDKGASAFVVHPAPDAAPPSAAEAWSAAHTLARALGAEVEPLFASEPLAPEPRIASAMAFGDEDEAPADTRWPLTAARVHEAWAALDVKGIGYGAGIKVGHPDTGYTKHPELFNGGAVLVEEGLNLVEGPGVRAIDPLDGGLNPGHGSRTGATIASRGGAQGRDCIIGVAPEAHLVPLRATTGVVLLFSQARIAKAIDHAVTRGCHVISMSLGGLPSGRLRVALQRAREAGTIVIAAAGNYCGVVVYPAAYPEVVAVAACDIDGRPWWGSSRGDAVAITAPGHQVWVPAWDRETRAGCAILSSSGTSYATAVTAGAAALWLSYHGVDELRARYPGAALPAAFEWVVQRHTTAPVLASDPTGFGAGRLDCGALLAHHLPALDELSRGLGARRAPAGGLGGGALAHAIPRLAPALEDDGLSREYLFHRLTAPAGAEVAAALGAGSAQLRAVLDSAGTGDAPQISPAAGVERALRLFDRVETLADALERPDTAAAAAVALPSAQRALLVKHLRAVSTAGRAARPAPELAMVLAAEELERFASYIVDQRRRSEFGVGLSAADQLVMSTWHIFCDPDAATVVPPLSVIDAAASPAVSTRHASLTAPSLLAGLRAGHGLAPLGYLPIVFVPVRDLDDARVFPLLAHETGHALDYAFGLSPALQDALAERTDDGHSHLWARWMREILADVVGVIATGPIFITALAEYMASFPAQLAPRPGTPYPPDRVRLELLVEVAAKLSGSAADMSALARLVEATPAARATFQLTPAVTGFVDWLLDAPLSGLRRRTLRAHADAFRVDRDRVSVAAAALADEEAIALPFRLAPAAAAGAGRTALTMAAFAGISDSENAGWVLPKVTFDFQALMETVRMTHLQARVTGEPIKVPPAELLRKAQRIAFVGGTHGQLFQRLADAFAARGEQKWDTIQIYALSNQALRYVVRDGLTHRDMVQERDAALARLRRRLHLWTDDGAIALHDSPTLFASYWDWSEPGGRIHVSAQVWGIDIRRCPGFDHVWVGERPSAAYAAYVEGLESVRGRARPWRPRRARV